MPTLHLFNPETDYALASGTDHYNPPSSIIKLRKKMALFPAVYAHRDDSILLADSLSKKEIELSPYYKDVIKKNISVVPLRQLHQLSLSDFNKIQPWGWNHSLRNLLISAGMPLHLLKTPEEIDRIRNLSHRRTTIPFQKHLADCLPHININTAIEFFFIEEALHFNDSTPKAFFKAPWSSSGRGVVCSSEMSRDKLEQWIGGFIRRQGSVMGEIGCERLLDFATEWECRNGNAKFLGLSLFHTSKEGRYMGNIKEPQKKLEFIISNNCNQWSQEIICAQKDTLDKIIAPYYDGPAGIDMLATITGHINPCVEINLRHTMGLISILENEQ